MATMRSRLPLLLLPRTTTATTRAVSRRTYGTVLPGTTSPPPAPEAPASPPASSVLQAAVQAAAPRSDWTKDEIRAIYHTPLMELAFSAVRSLSLSLSLFLRICPDKQWAGQATVHRRFHDPAKIQLCTLHNIKTGGCSEDCSYCSQSSRHKTGLKATPLASVETVLAAARTAKANGSTRFCMGAAWRDMRGRKSGLRNIAAMVSGIRAMDMEVCVTLGMIDDTQAQQLKAAGLTAYNHNVDTSREFYPSVITTRSYDERLATLQHVRDAGLSVCSGGILGLGEATDDHVGLLYTLASLPQHPESVPINALVPIRGTPLQDASPLPFSHILRTVATARCVMPAAVVRLAAGRISMPEEQQALCFMAGANAVFTGERMLTTDCSGWDEDKAMMDRWGLRPMGSFARPEGGVAAAAAAAGPEPSAPGQEAPAAAPELSVATGEPPAAAATPA